MQVRKTLLYGMALFACGLYTTSANSDPVTATLFYTTLGGPPNNVGLAVVTLSESTLTVNSNSPLASVNGAAGIIIAPDGNLLIGGQSADFGGGTRGKSRLSRFGTPAHIHEITPSGTFVGDGILPPGNGAYQLALDPATASQSTVLRVLCNAPIAGCGAHFSQFFPLNSPITGQVGISLPLSGPPGANLNVTSLAFDPANNTHYYGATSDGSTEGQFGTITFGEGAGEMHLFPGLFPANNLAFDAFSNTIIMSSGPTIAQFDPTADAIVSSITIPGESFEQASVDGNGHLFVVSNTGDLLGVDFDKATHKLINGRGATHAVAFLATDLVGVVAQIQPALRFAGTPGKANCYGRSVSALVRQYHGLHAAAAALEFSSVRGLEKAILEFCEG